MQYLIRSWHKLVDDQAGQGLIEYGAIVALIAIGTLSLLSLLYSEVAGMFGHAATTLQSLIAHR